MSDSPVGDITIRQTYAIKLFNYLWEDLNAMVWCSPVFFALGRVSNHGGRG